MQNFPDYFTMHCHQHQQQQICVICERPSADHLQWQLHWECMQWNDACIRMVALRSIVRFMILVELGEGEW